MRQNTQTDTSLVISNEETGTISSYSIVANGVTPYHKTRPFNRIVAQVSDRVRPGKVLGSSGSTKPLGERLRVIHVVIYHDVTSHSCETGKMTSYSKPKQVPSLKLS